MATELTVGDIKASIGWTYVDDKPWADSRNSGTFSLQKSFSDGSGAGRANKIYVLYDTAGLAASGTTSFDLTALTDMYANALSFSKVKLVYVENTAVTSSMALGGAAANAWAGASQFFANTTDIVNISAGGWMYVGRTDATGYPTSATQKALLVTNSNGTYTLPYKMVIVGE